jgi:hypothetical protein
LINFSTTPSEANFAAAAAKAAQEVQAEMAVELSNRGI